MADITIVNGVINQLITGGHHPVVISYVAVYQRVVDDFPSLFLPPFVGDVPAMFDGCGKLLPKLFDLRNRN